MVDLRRASTLAGRAVMYEISLYRSLFRWVTRRPATRDPQVLVVGYARDVTPLTCLWIFASAVEMPIAHVLVPWESVRTVLLVVSVWGLVWMFGLLASLRTRPHLSGPETLQLRYSSRREVELAWADVREVRMDRRDTGSSIRPVIPRETERGTDLQIGVGGQVNVTALLRRPVPVRLPDGVTEVVQVSFLVDDPREFVAHARERLTAVQPA